MAEREQTRYADVASWELSDSMWERIAPLLPPRQPHYRGRGKHKRNVGGRPWVDARQAMSGILYVLRTGCPWKAVPRHFGTGSTIHRYFQNWTEAGVFEQMWQAGLSEYDDVIGIGWKWQAADGAMTKAPLGGEDTGPNPTDRAKSGTKRSLLVDENGVPLALTVSGANTPDANLLDATLAAKQTKEIEPDDPDTIQNLCLDKGYSGEPSQKVADKYGYELHVPDKVNATQKRKRKPGRRKARRKWPAAGPWIVEVAHSWINRFRRLLIRWEKKTCNYLALLAFACAIICWRKCEVLG